MPTIDVRPLQPSDREAWSSLWRGYLDFYRTERPPDIYDLLWERLLGSEPGDGHGLIARADGAPVGLAHYYFQRHGWYAEQVVYLQDLYAAPSARGTGVGRALIEAVYAAADAADCPRVYWTTEDNNAVARRLYDRIGELTPFIKYQRAI
ncbi:MAG: GNAT family N-acetyltransferase [Pseudomonadota bacterium]